MFNASSESIPASERGVAGSMGVSSRFCSPTMVMISCSISFRSIPAIIRGVRPANFLRRYFRVLYVAWILVCVISVVALRNRPDPSRAGTELDSDAAARRAVAILQTVDGSRFRGYDVATVAYARTGELGGQSRWIVLCDRVERTGLSDAVVVELSPDGRRLLRLRPVING
jgi:hypothetical protein